MVCQYVECLLVVFFAAEIQKLKSTVSKTDKKKKKEVAEKIASLEADQARRHEKELQELQEQVLTPNSLSFLWKCVVKVQFHL